MARRKSAPRPHSEFADVLAKAMPLAHANAYAKGFATGTTGQQELIICDLNLSHALVALALYGERY